MPHMPARPAPAVGAGGRPQRGVDVGPLALRALKAHRCMKRRKPRARRQRVDADVSARYAFAKLAQDPHHGVSRALYRFALEFVGLAIPPIGELGPPAIRARGFDLMKEAIREATQAIAAVRESQILPHVGAKSQ